MQNTRTKKCTGVAGRASPDGQVPRRNPVISVVRLPEDMNFALTFQFGSAEARATAAKALAVERSHGYQHLPSMIDAVARLDLDTDTLDKFEIQFVASCARTMGSILSDVGFKHDVELHTNMLTWLIENASNRHLHIAAWCIYGMGDIDPTPTEVITRLKQLVVSDIRPDEAKDMTCRGVAFRVLSRLDRNAAIEAKHSSACREYLAGIESWIVQSRSVSNDDYAEELEAESAWLRTS
jgi:hypothetical protein